MSINHKLSGLLWGIRAGVGVNDFKTDHNFLSFSQLLEVSLGIGGLSLNGILSGRNMGAEGREVLFHLLPVTGGVFSLDLSHITKTPSVAYIAAFHYLSFLVAE